MDFDGYCLENLRTAFAVSTCCNGRRAGARVPWGGVGAVCGSPAGAGSGGHGGQPELVTMPEGGEGLQAVLLRAAAPTRRTIAASVGEMPRHVGAAFDLADQALERIGNRHGARGAAEPGEIPVFAYGATIRA